MGGWGRLLSATACMVALCGCGGGFPAAEPPPIESGVATPPTVPRPKTPGVEQRTEAWATNFGGSEVSLPAAVAEDTVVVVDKAGVVRAFDRAGASVWEQTLVVPGDGIYDASPPVVVDGTVVVALLGDTRPASSLAVYGLDLVDGDVLWESDDFNHQYHPVFVSDGNLVFTASHDTVYAIDPGNGRSTWSVEVGGLLGGSWRLWSAGEVVVVGYSVGSTGAADGRGTVIALDARDGAERWTLDEEAWGADAVDGTVVLEVTDLERGFPFLDRELLGIDAADGSRLWSLPSSDEREPIGLVAAGDAIIAASGRSLVVLDAGPDGGRRWEARPGVGGLSLGRYYIMPLLVDGAVVIGGGNGEIHYVRAYDLDDGTLLAEWSGGDRPIGLATFQDGELAVTLGGATGGGTVAAVPLLGGADDAPAALLGIPSPSEALTLKNATYAAGILGALMVLVAVPTSLFNEALSQRLDLKRVGRRRRGPARPVGTGVATGRRRWAPALAFTVLGALLYSLLEPSFGANATTAVTAIAFWVALMVVILVESVVVGGLERSRYRTNTGRPVVSFATLAIGALCVAGSRAIAFVPGYLYGVLVNYRTETELTDRDEGDAELRAAVGVLAVALLAWFALGVLPDSPATVGFGSLPVAVAGAVFMAGVETLAVGLLPLRLLPGAKLRRHHPRWWKALWATSGFLVVLALLHPGLADAQGRSIGWLLAGAAAYGTIAVAFWWTTSRRAAPPAGPPAVNWSAPSGAAVEPREQELTS